MCVVKITQGGGVAAPVGGQVLSEVLPYIEASKDNLEEGEEIEIVEVPKVEGMKIKEVKERLKEIGLEAIIEDEVQLDDIVKSQVPKYGVKVDKGSKVYLK